MAGGPSKLKILGGEAMQGWSFASSYSCNRQLQPRGSPFPDRRGAHERQSGAEPGAACWLIPFGQACTAASSPNGQCSAARHQAPGRPGLLGSARPDIRGSVCQNSPVSEMATRDSCPSRTPITGSTGRLGMSSSRFSAFEAPICRILPSRRMGFRSRAARAGPDVILAMCSGCSRRFPLSGLTPG